jgi:hypothetical protein
LIIIKKSNKIEKQTVFASGSNDHVRQELAAIHLVASNGQRCLEWFVAVLCYKKNSKYFLCFEKKRKRREREGGRREEGENEKEMK